MRIAHLLFTKRFAGSERYAIELANAQAADHEVFFLLAQAAAEDRADAWASRLDPRVQQVRLVLPTLAPGWRVARWASRVQPDVMHAHLSFACKSLARAHSARARVATLHIAYKARQHRHLDGLIAITPSQLAQVPADYAGRVRQISNWSAPRAPAPGARERLRAAWGIGPDELLIGTLGRGERSKGWDVLVEAFRAARLPRARLVLVGEGPQWQSVRDLAPPEVVMPGFTNEPENCLSAFDGFVSAARSEPFGLVFLEALHAGLPVIATATEGATFLRDHFDAVVPNGDTAALAGALSQLAERHARGEALRRTHDLAPFSRQARVAEIEAFYRECLGEVPAAR